MRCQLCDGPVVGGRCKSCGMPYKNDAVLYHVNEDRKTHDRHASEKAKMCIRDRSSIEIKCYGFVKSE